MTTITSQTEFWAAGVGAIVGAVVSGLISYGIQIKVLREGRNQRAEDRQISQQALATALIFKIGKTYSNISALHKHLEECFGIAGDTKPQREAWQVFIPLSNLPDRISFATDEMGLLLAMNNDDIFNLVLALDDVHNSLWGSVRTLQEEHALLLEQIRVVRFEGDVGKIELDHATQLRLRPRMIKVNRIAEQLRANTKRAMDESQEALSGAQELLRDKLELSFGLAYMKSEDS